MRRWFVLGLVVASAGVWLQCSSFESTPPTTTIVDGAVEGSSENAAPDGALADAGPDARCPSAHGEMILVEGAFCIDKYETTYGQYREFLFTRGTDAATPFVECQWMTTLNPSQPLPGPSSQDNFAIPNVTWCAARTYCEWAGKRLCGARGSGENVVEPNLTSPADEWYVACSSNGSRAYPYGNTFDASACGTSPHEVGSMPGCQGGYPGLFDMLGNAQEWESSCISMVDDAGPTNDHCFTRGAEGIVEAGVTCATRGRLFRHNHAGIRCCATPNP